MDRVSSIVLCGGQGRRMNGRDKGLLSFRDQPLVAHVIQRLVTQHDGPLLINCNRNTNQYRKFGYPVFQDDPQFPPGPLAGIATALSAARTPWCLFSPCDTPFLPEDYLERLYEGADRHGADLAYVHDGNRSQILHCLVRTSLSAHLSEWFRKELRAVHAWQADVHSHGVDFATRKDCFRNINTAEDLRAYEQFSPGDTP